MGLYHSTAENVKYLTGNVYALLACLSLVCMTLRALVLAQHRLGTSTLLQRQLLTATLRAPIAFFDITPLGRILNRFSSDMMVIDEEISATISQVTNGYFQCIGALGAVAGATSGTTFILCSTGLYIY